MTALYKGTQKNGPAVLLRSYDSRREPPPEFDCTIWQAGRATSATGLAFKPIQIGQHVFIDEGPGTYNPAPQILDEAVVNEWPGREIGVFVSVGTGRRPPGTNNRQHEWWEDFIGGAVGTFAEARRRLITKIEGCEAIHTRMLQEYLPQRNVNKDNYYRLNVEVGVGEFGMNEWNRLADISTNTRQYLAKPEVKKMILDAGVKFAKIERMNRRLAEHAAAGGDRDDLSFDLEREEITIAQSVEEPEEHAPHSTNPNHAPPTLSVPPPSHSFAVELPAEPVEFYPHSPAHASPPRPTSVMPSADALPAHPIPQDNISIYGPHAGFESESSYTLSAPVHTSEPFLPNGMPPPIPPKTPIPYPSQEDGGAGVSMPAPLFSHSPPIGGPAQVRPPYPMDEAPPVINRQRKPSYHVR